MKPLDPRLLKEAEAAKWFIASLVALSFVSVACTIAIAWFLTAFISGIFKNTISLDASYWLLAPVAIAGLIKAMVFGLQEMLAVRTASRVKAQLRAKLLDAVADPALLSRFSSAEFSNTFSRGLDSLDAYFSKYLPQLVISLIATSILGLVITASDLISGVILALTLPLIPLFMVLIGLATRAAQKSQVESLTKLGNHFSQIIRGLTTLRVFDRGEAVTKSLETAGNQYRKRTMKVLRFSFLSSFALELGASLAVALMAVSIGFRLIWGELDLTTGLFVLLLAPEAFLPLRQLGVQYHAATDGIENTAKALQMLDPKHLKITPTPASTLSLLTHRQMTMLEEISAVLGQPRGSFLSMSGKSGVGKSTVLRHLANEANPSKVIYSPQRVQLIGSDVLSGIIGPEETATGSVDQSRLARAMELANLDDTPVNLEIGGLQKTLSGGQQQRIALARAFYFALSEPGATLLLDEPLSSVDSVRSASIVRNFGSLAQQGFKILVVSHQAVVHDYSQQNWELEHE